MITVGDNVVDQLKDADWFELADKLHFQAFENINI
jgi:hypothetical protein